ncbi:hypothetical protein [Deefgea salmonis]|uniref:Lipoprotein n=1 Tax=Deefgea salmonis TaxID=2875502 RepID=A0ABS8BJJ4_9NEIS|nr:hypothetical protein [Deefgea salmonis]MCB5195890.1 hypothetical protein [Deefgea salmonis]
MLRNLSLLGLVVLMSGCSTYTVQRYSVKADNVVAYRDSQKKFNVAPFSAKQAAQTEIMCRGVGPIKTPDNQTFADYVSGAVKDELKLAGAYDAQSALVLSGTLDEVKFDSMAGLWTLSLTMSSSNGNSATKQELYKYTSSFYGETACNQTAQAFMPAVQNLLAQFANDAKLK